MPSPAGAEPKSLVPLCVDLDGTVIKTDLLWESLVRLLKHNALYLFAVPFWLLRGRAHLKAQIAARVAFDVSSLPYNHALIEFLSAEQRRERTILLVTASDARLARLVAQHLRIFTDVLGSDGRTNLRGKNKAARLAELFGGRGFDYAGNSSVDLPVWEQARHAILVGSNSRLAARARKCADVSRVFEEPKSFFHVLVQTLRPHQWVKNLIVFVPLLTSHKLTQLPLFLDALVAFVAFSVCASAVYILNDLLDLEADRHHPNKRLRPFACGALPLSAGLAMFPLLLVVGGVLTFQLSWSFAVALGVYLLSTTSYSLRIKQVPLLDVFFLAGLYTIRLVAGHEATGIEYSFWLLAFAMFIFLSLALVKRFVEVDAVCQQNGSDVKGRGYTAKDFGLIATLGTASGYLAGLVMALYVNSPEVRVLYRHPTMLLVICPLLLYWISRVWMLAHRGHMHEDPIVFALKDRVSYVVAALNLARLWLATGH